jgi:hypothetical protein
LPNRENQSKAVRKMPAFLIPALLLAFAGVQYSEAAVTASVKMVSTWNGGGQASIVFANSGPAPVCTVTFKLTMPSGVSG